MSFVPEWLVAEEANKQKRRDYSGDGHFFPFSFTESRVGGKPEQDSLSDFPES